MLLVHQSWLKICVVWGAFIKGSVESEPLVDDAFGLDSALQFAQTDRILLKGPPQPFDEYIVEVTPRPYVTGRCLPANTERHRDLDPRIDQGGVPDPQ